MSDRCVEKIDRSFIQEIATDCHDAAIDQGIIAMAITSV